ncbi:MAG: hypothetical protein HGA72_09360 [Chlorobiaceae bacterium]|jgi:hypothetical protein|nr:hypothetical protein [Chlorobiaceae bacterium]
MVGLKKFASHFADYQDRYLLIGGAATWLVLDAAGLEPRATKDLDIVLCVEVLDANFGIALWEFIRAGGYEIQEKGQGEKSFYRFRRPIQRDYPVMLELFSRKPDGLTLNNNSQLTPIPIDENISSLSAILLEDDYYNFLHRHKREIEGISIVGEECLIPLKARAWMDLSRRKEKGEQIDSKNIRKHRNDILRLYQVLSPNLNIELPESIKKDLQEFLLGVEPELTPQLLKDLTISGESIANIINTINTVYRMIE